MVRQAAEDKVAAIRAGVVEAHRLGITSVQNAGGTVGDLELYDGLRKRGQLSLRVYQALSVNGVPTGAELAQLTAARERFADDPLLKAGAVKLVADGVIESHTAAMLEPYNNKPNTAGDQRFTAPPMAKLNGSPFSRLIACTPGTLRRNGMCSVS